MPDSQEEFDRIVKGLTMNSAAESIDQNPYGGPVTHNSGLTKRGKAALGIGAAVIGGGFLIGYQVHSANIAESEAKAQEIALKSQALELEKIRELNRASEAGRKAAASDEKARQASIDACVKSNSDLVGKGYGSPSHRDVISDCQTQYSGSPSGDEIAVAGAAENASGGAGGVNQGLLLGGGVLVVFLVAAAKKGTRSNAA